jgi:hypothetical protein
MSGTRKSAQERREAAAAGNSGGTAAPIPIGRRFQPGQSGNPAGRPKGIAAVVRERTDPSAMVGILLEVAEDPRAKPSERIAAVRELLDRGYGKAPAFAAIEGNDPLELSAIAQEIQGIADELAARRQNASESAENRAADTG